MQGAATRLHLPRASSLPLNSLGCAPRQLQLAPVCESSLLGIMGPSPRDSPVLSKIDLIHDGPIGELSSAIKSSVHDLAFVGGLMFLESNFREQRQKRTSAFTTTAAQPSPADLGTGYEAIDFTGAGVIYDDTDLTRQTELIASKIFDDIHKRAPRHEGGSAHSQLSDDPQESDRYRPSTFFL